MKLILENWNRYIDETESRSACGDIYLFEENNIKKSSFYDSLNSLTESEDSIELFLENWERSIDYVFENLNEVSGGDISQAILQAEVQAMMLLGRGKDKALKSVAKTINKIKGALPKIEDPKKAKIAKYALGGLAAAAIAAALVTYGALGGDPNDLQAVVQAGSDVVPEIAAQASEALQSTDKQAVGEIASKVMETASQASDQLGNVNDQTAQQMAKQMDQTLNTSMFDLDAGFFDAEDNNIHSQDSQDSSQANIDYGDNPPTGLRGASRRVMQGMQQFIPDSGSVEIRVKTNGLLPDWFDAEAITRNLQKKYPNANISFNTPVEWYETAQEAGIRDAGVENGKTFLNFDLWPREGGTQVSVNPIVWNKKSGGAGEGIMKQILFKEF